MDDHEIPHHFICPISLQIMKDPVTVVTGITYDRDSIQRWQACGQNNTCPVTNQPLPTTSDFTPNHNLRRLIESWCASQQIVPTTLKQSCHLKVNKLIVVNLIKNLKQQDLQVDSLKSIEKLALESEENRVLLKEVGVVKAMVMIVVLCYRNGTIVGLNEALNVLYLAGFPQDDAKRSIIVDHDRIIRMLTWVLDLDPCDDIDIDICTSTTMKFHAIVLLKEIIQIAKSQVLERLNRDFFKTIVLILQQRRKGKKLEKGIKEALHVMLATCTWPRNCSMMIESGAVFELVELELGSPEKGITELIMGVLFHLCSTADGRAQLVGHAAGIAIITKRIGRVNSPKVAERALMIISLVSKFSATDGVLQEMVRVGTVMELCMLIQVNNVPHDSYSKDKARQILKRHSNVWKDSPCLDVTLLTRYLN